MINAFLGIKLDQSRTFTKEGHNLPITHILTNPCKVVDLITIEKNGYSALQLGSGNRRAKTITQAQIGHLKKAGMDKNPPRFLREVAIKKGIEGLKPGLEIKCEEVFKEGDKVNVVGISKGKGFQGVVKRHHFKGGPRTHGQSDRERAPGAIGQTTTPGRVYKGKRMAGRMGNDQVTVRNLEIVKIDTEKNIISVLGLVPGGRNSLLIIKKAAE